MNAEALGTADLLQRWRTKQEMAREAAKLAAAVSDQTEQDGFGKCGCVLICSLVPCALFRVHCAVCRLACILV